MTSVRARKTRKARDLVIVNVRFDGRAELVDIGILAERIATIALRIDNEAPQTPFSDFQKK